MADDMENESLKEGSENIVKGMKIFSKGGYSVLLNIASFLTNSRLGWAISLAIGAVLSPVILKFVGMINSYFFSQTVPVNRDITLETLQGAPVGLSIVLLTFGLIFVAMYSYTRIVTLRQRVEKLEEDYKP